MKKFSVQYVAAWMLLASSSVLTGCGITGDKGAAIFHVGNNWQKGVGIAVGSRFAVSAERNDLTRKPLIVTSTKPTVIPVATGGFQAVTEGGAQFQASDALGIAVDTVEFNAVAPGSVALGAWWSNSFGTPVALAQHFALVQGGRYVGAILVRDVAGARLNHAAIAEVTCDLATVKVVDDYVAATPTTLGKTVAKVAVKDAAGATKTTASYNIQVVTPAEVAHLKVNSATVQTGASAPADPDKGPVNPDPADTTTAPKTQLFLLAIDASLADGTPVYGPTVTWTESGTGHLLTKQSNGGNYAVLKSGESVTVTATLGTLTAQIALVAP